LDPPEGRQSEQQTLFGDFGAIGQDPSAPFIASAVAFAGTPPMEFLAAFVDAFITDVEKRKTVSRRVFGTYAQWLTLLGDQGKRERLESLSHDQARNDEVFQEISDMSAEFSKGLQLIFFNRDGDPDPIAQLSFEYVAF
jgi:hypothetical protein